MLLGLEIQTVRNVLNNVIGLTEDTDFTVCVESVFMEIHFDERLDLGGVIYQIRQSMPIGTVVVVDANKIMTISR